MKMKYGQREARGKPEEEIAEAIKPPYQPPIGAPPSEQRPTAQVVQESETAVAAVVATGPQAVDLVDEARAGEGMSERDRRAEERWAEDRRGIIETGARYGITISEERAEQIRARAFDAADEAAISDSTLADAREAGYAATGGFDVTVQSVRDAYHTVIGDAAASAARHVLEDELAGEGLSGENLEQAAREMSRLARVREVRDASSGSRAMAEELIAQRQAEYGVQNAQDDLRVLQSSVADARSAAQEARDNPQNAEAALQRARDAAQQAREVAGTMAEDYAGNPDVAQTVAQAQQVAAQVAAEVQEAEADVRAQGISQVAFTFNFNIDEAALPWIGGVLGYEPRGVLTETGGIIDRQHIFDHCGIDIHGRTTLRFDTDGMHTAGLLTDDEMRQAEEMARTNNTQALFEFLKSQAGGRLSEFTTVETAGAEVSSARFFRAIDFLADMAGDLRGQQADAGAAIRDRCSTLRTWIAQDEEWLRSNEGRDAGTRVADPDGGTRPAGEVRTRVERRLPGWESELEALRQYESGLRLGGIISYSYSAAGVS